MVRRSWTTAPGTSSAGNKKQDPAGDVSLASTVLSAGYRGAVLATGPPTPVPRSRLRPLGGAFGRGTVSSHERFERRDPDLERSQHRRHGTVRAYPDVRRSSSLFSPGGREGPVRRSILALVLTAALALPRPVAAGSRGGGHSSSQLLQPFERVQSLLAREQFQSPFALELPLHDALLVVVESPHQVLDRRLLLEQPRSATPSSGRSSCGPTRARRPARPTARARATSWTKFRL